MIRFEQEWPLVPTAARVIAVLAAMAVVALVAFAFLAQPPAEGEAAAPIYWGLFLLALILPAGLIAVFVLLVGYVWGDAHRRRMNAVLWTLLAIFIPNMIGIILYFILRDPLPVSCPSCAASVPKSQACCTSCGATLASSCPQCHQPVDPSWAHCGGCGAVLQPATASPTP
jgi:hypothetical protein